MENIHFIAEGDLGNLLQLDHYVLCITVTYLRSLAFKVDELNQFSCASQQEISRWNEMTLWVHKTTLTTTSETGKS